jgi:branched-chain amino acid aminotransferase
MNFVCFNNKILPASEPALTIQNRGYKWGDGVFETMKVHKGSVLFEELHFDRLSFSLKLLGIDAPFRQKELAENILKLCSKNNCTELARVRLEVYREENGGAGYTIEAIPLDEAAMNWNKRGLTLTISPHARKANDAFANLKSANFLPYVMASIYAQQNSWDDALVLNSNNAIADSCRANIFLIRNEEVFTPALHQGCVNGVMRKFVIDWCKKNGFVVHQEQITEADLLNADEVFLTNAIQGIRWVQRFKEKEYGFEKTFNIYRRSLSTIYS